MKPKSFAVPYRYSLVAALLLSMNWVSSVAAQTDQLDISGVGSVSWTDGVNSGTAQRAAGGNVTGDLNPGSGTFEFSASPGFGWAFDRFEIPLQQAIISTPTTSATISGGETLVTYFHPELRVSVGTGGTVSVDAGSDNTTQFPCIAEATCTEAFNNETSNTIVVTAVPEPGFEFVGWDANVSCGTNPICPLTVSGDGGIDALPQQMFAQFQAITSGGSDTDGDGVIDEIDICPNTLPGAVVDSSGCSADQQQPPQNQEPSFFFTGSGQVDWSSVTSVLTAAGTCASGVGSQDLVAAANGSCALPIGPASVNLSATAEPGWEFVSYAFEGTRLSGPDVDTTAQVLYDYASQPFVTVDFDPLLAVTVAGSGSVGVSYNGTVLAGCPQETVCEEAFDDELSGQITLEAVPAVGFEFVGWTGNTTCGTSLQCNVAVAGGGVDALPNSLVATFNAISTVQDEDLDGVPDAQDECPATPSTDTADDFGCGDSQVFLLTGAFLGDGAGRIQDATNTADFCDSTEADCIRRVTDPSNVVTVEAVPAEGSEFAGWGGLCAGTTGTQCELSVPPGQSGTVTATFNLLPPEPVLGTASVALSGEGQGSVTGSELGINCPDSCTGQFATGIDQVTLVAQPAAGSVFAGWGGDGCDSVDGLQCIVGASATNTSVVAIFEPEAAETLTVAVEGNGSVTDELLGIDCPAQRCSAAWPASAVSTVLTAAPASGFAFAGWTGGDCPTTGNTCSVVKATVTVSATFVADADNDGVPDTQDVCPNTPTDAAVDEEGCALSQLDGDEDGVTDDIDECPQTVAGAEVDSVGCSVADEEIKDFGEDLGTLEGLTESEQEVAVEVDNTCAALVQADAAEGVELTPEQRDLRNACSNLKNNNSTPEQQAEALRVITPEEEIGAQVDYIVNLANAQNQHVTNRLNVVSAGGGRGVSIAGLNLNVAGQLIPGHVIENTLKEMLAGSGDSFADFGKLGVFLQGDLDFGERDQDANNDGYEFDSWSLTAGADYRFTDTFFAGASVSMGAVEVTTRDRLGNTDVDNIRFTTYAGWQITDNLFIDGQLAYTKADYELARTVAYTDAGGEFRSVYLGDTDGDQLSAGLNIGYMLNKGGWRFGPTATVSYIDGTVNGYRERAQEGDSAAWAFAINDQDYSLLRTTLGVQVDYAIATDFGVLLPGFRAAYVNEDEDANEFVPLTFVNNPFGGIDGNTITVTKPTRDSQYFDSAFNLSGQFPYGISAYASYRFYSAFDGYEQTGYTLGIRWDRAF